MGDVVFLALMIGFFVLTVLFVRACDRIIGPSDGGPEPAPTYDAGRSGVRR